MSIISAKEATDEQMENCLFHVGIDDSGRVCLEMEGRMLVFGDTKQAKAAGEMLMMAANEIDGVH